MRCPSEQPGTWVTVLTGDMGNTFPGLFTPIAAVVVAPVDPVGSAQRCPHVHRRYVWVCADGPCYRRWCRARPDRRPHASPIMLVQSDGLADQRRADVDLLAAPPDPAIGPDPPHDLVRAVVGFAQHAVKGA